MADPPARNDGEMGEILASIRKIVMSEGARPAASADARGDSALPVLELDEEMRVERPLRDPGLEPDEALARIARREADDSEPAPDDESEPEAESTAAEGSETLDLGLSATLVSPPPSAPRPAFAPQPPSPPAKRDAAPAGALVIAEDQIEEIVRRVIREELRGQVGVEISRKVKSVIRDEVRRVIDEDDPLI